MQLDWKQDFSADNLDPLQTLTQVDCVYLVTIIGYRV